MCYNEQEAKQRKVKLVIWMTAVGEKEGYCEKSPRWRRNPKLPQGLDGKRRTVNFMNLPKCCPCRRLSPHSWTKPPSYDWPQATWRWELSSPRVSSFLLTPVLPFGPHQLQAFTHQQHNLSGVCLNSCQLRNSGGLLHWQTLCLNKIKWPYKSS